MSFEIKYGSPIFLSNININNNIETPNHFLKFKNIVSNTENNYKIINYDKTLLSADLISTYGLYRSVIINNKNQVVCYAPPKSFSSDYFIKKYSFNNNSNSNSIIAEEFVEGTMINVFWNETWEISTRNTVSANSSFYQTTPKKTFRAMFLEACKEINLSFENLNKKYCYSFVLQHPENRIVVPFKKPALYLVAAYLIVNENNGINALVYPVILNNINNEHIHHFGLDNSFVQFPKKYTDCDSYTKLIEKYASMNTSYDILGVVLYNSITCERSKIRNPVYEQVRQLRGNQPKLQYQYLHLRNQGKIADFLKYFPENKRKFGEFRDQVHLFTNTLFSNYISCYIKKEKPLIEFSSQYRTHMFKIHELFLSELRPKKLFVTNTVVINYVNSLHPSQQMFAINYNMRKRMVDFITNDEPISEE